MGKKIASNKGLASSKVKAETCEGCIYFKIHACTVCGERICRRVLEVKGEKGMGGNGQCVWIGHFMRKGKVICVKCEAKVMTTKEENDGRFRA